MDSFACAVASTGMDSIATASLDYIACSPKSLVWTAVSVSLSPACAARNCFPKQDNQVYNVFFKNIPCHDEIALGLELLHISFWAAQAQP